MQSGSSGIPFESSIYILWKKQIKVVEDIFNMGFFTNKQSIQLLKKKLKKKKRFESMTWEISVL